MFSGRFSGLSKSLKGSPFQELASLLAMWFKHARGSNRVISSRLLRDRAHTLPQGWALKTFKLLMAGLTVSSSDTVLSIKSYQKRAQV